MTLPYFQVDTRNERLKTLSVKHASLWDEFNQKLDISWIYHDHGLEGVVLQYQEISIALNNKVISDSSFLPMYQEIKNMNAGIHMIRELNIKKSRDRITRGLMQQCYSTLSQKLRGVPEGDGIRQEDGRYGAYYHRSCTFTEIEAMLKKVLSEANQTSSEELHPIVQATRLHFRLMKVMPYGRFSGKISRLLANLMLMRNGYPPAILHTVERARYYESLSQEDESQLLHLVIEGLTNTVESGLQYIEDGLAERRRKREARKATKLQRQEKAKKSSKTTKAKPTKTKAKATKAKTTKAAPAKPAAKAAKPTTKAAKAKPAAEKAAKATKTTKATKAAKPTAKTAAKATPAKAAKAESAPTKATKTAEKKTTKAAKKASAPAEKATKAAKPAKSTTKAAAPKKAAKSTTKAAKATTKTKTAKPAAKPTAKATKKPTTKTKTAKPAAKSTTKTKATKKTTGAKTKAAKPKATKTASKSKPKATAKKSSTGTRQSAKKASSTKAKSPKTTKSAGRKPSRKK